MAETLVVAVFALIGIITQRIIGFGTALFLTPALLIYFDPPISVAVTLFAGGISSLVLLYMDKRHLELSWPIVIRLVITAIPGLLIGSYIVTHINKSLLQIIVGLLIIFSVLIQDYVFPKSTRRLEVTKGIGISGFSAGVLNATAAMAPPPLVLWMRAHITTPNQIRHNLAAIFILINSCSIASIHFLKPASFDTKGVYIALLLLPLIVLGNIIGKDIARRINVRLYHRVIFWAIIFAGASSTVLGLTSL